MSAAEDRLTDPFQTAPVSVTLPRILTGQIDSAGTITAGSGFTVNRSGTGTYDITFSTAFSAAPTVVATLKDGGAFNRVLFISSPATTGVTVNVGSTATGATVNLPFTFVAHETA